MSLKNIYDTFNAIEKRFNWGKTPKPKARKLHEYRQNIEYCMIVYFDALKLLQHDRTVRGQDKINLQKRCRLFAIPLDNSNCKECLKDALILLVAKLKAIIKGELDKMYRIDKPTIQNEEEEAQSKTEYAELKYELGLELPPHIQNIKEGTYEYDGTRFIVQKEYLTKGFVDELRHFNLLKYNENEKKS